MNVLQTRSIQVNWVNVTLPLKKGTPISMGGEISNNSNAVGIVMDNITVKPLFPSLLIMVGGDVKLNELEYTLSDEALASMDGIRFYGADGTPQPNRSLVVPKATKTKDGIVKMAEKVTAVTPAGETPTAVESAINSILTALKSAGIMES